MRMNEPVTQTGSPQRENKGILSRTDAKGRTAHVDQVFIGVDGHTSAEPLGQPHRLTSSHTRIIAPEFPRHPGSVSRPLTKGGPLRFNRAPSMPRTQAFANGVRWLPESNADGSVPGVMAGYCAATLSSARRFGSTYDRVCTYTVQTLRTPSQRQSLSQASVSDLTRSIAELWESLLSPWGFIHSAEDERGKRCIGG